MEQQQQQKFPSIKETVAKIKQDLTYENQYSTLLHYDLIDQNDQSRNQINKILNFSQKLTCQESKAIGCFIGLSVGDALGCLTDNFPLDYTRKEITCFQSMSQLRLPRGLYSDDTSLALCLADSLIANNYQYSAIDVRHRFALWWYEGLNNGKSPYFSGQISDISELKPEVKNSWNELSFGIGNTIWTAIFHFLRFPSQSYVSGDMQKQADSNGSIMRLAPIPICFYDNLEECCRIAAEQSKSTHFGLEAADCCRILSYICASAISQKEPIQSTQQFLDTTLAKLDKDIEFDSSSAPYLVRGQAEEDFEEDIYNQEIIDRNWNWRAKEYRYSPTRTKLNPEGVGAYSMDCLAMALNIVYYSTGFVDAILKACNLGGDADTLGAVVGQIAGSIYGFSEEMNQYYSYVRKWDLNKVIIRAYKLFHKQLIK